MKLTNALGGCANCGALTSPCWRKGPEDARHLCNACGSRYLVKGTLEGYKPGQKNRAGSKRAKKGKGLANRAQDGGSPSDYTHKRNSKRSNSDQICYVDKAVQVDPLELQGMLPFPHLLAAAGGSGTYLTQSCSPTSPLERLTTEDRSDGSLDAAQKLRVEIKASSDENSPDRDELSPNPENVSRRRARKPCKPTSSTW